MTGSNFVKSLRERIVTVLSLAFVFSASVSMVPRANAQCLAPTATGIGKAVYATSSSGWSLGTTDVTRKVVQNGGVAFGSIPGGTATATGTITLGAGPSSVYCGIAKVWQTFQFTPSTGPFTTLVYTITPSASAVSNSASLGASGEADDGATGGDILAGGSPGVQSIFNPSPTAVVNTFTVTPTTDTFIDTSVYLFGQAFQPAGISGGCTIAVPTKKAKQKVRVPSGRASL